MTRRLTHTLSAMLALLALVPGSLLSADVVAESGVAPAAVTFTHTQVTNKPMMPGLPAIAVDGAGNAHMAFVAEDGNGDEQVFHASNATGSWASVQATSFTGTSPWWIRGPSLAVDVSGHAHIVYDVGDGSTSAVHYVSNTGFGWTDTPISGATADNFSSNIAVDASGTAHVVYRHFDGTLDEIHYATNAGGTWSTGIIASSTAQNWQPTVACDDTGDVHVAYSSHVGGSYQIIYATYNGTSWTSTPITSGSHRHTQPAIAWGGGGVHIAYTRTEQVIVPPLYWNHYLVYANNLGGSWSSTAVDSSLLNNLGSDVTGHLVADSLGKAHTVYSVLEDTGIRLAYASNSSGSWVHTSLPVSWFPNVSDYDRRLALDPSGRVHIGYFRVPQGDDWAQIYHARSDQVVDSGLVCENVIQNGTFETGTLSSWQNTGSPTASGAHAYGGGFSALLGGRNNADDVIYQSVSLPTAPSSAVLTFWWFITTAEGGIATPPDHLWIEAQDSSGTVLETLHFLHNTHAGPAWQQTIVDLKAYPSLLGRTFRLAFHGTTDGQDITSFYIDDVQVGICRPPGLSPTVGFSPPQTAVPAGTDYDIGVRIDGAEGLYGAQVRISFDPTQMQIADVDPMLPGVQIAPGPLFDPETSSIALNVVNNEAGTIDYAVTLLSPAEPLSEGGLLASLPFHCLAEGASELVLEQVLLSDCDGYLIEADVGSGLVEQISDAGAIQGRVLLQGRDQAPGGHEGVRVIANGHQALTNEQGFFAFGVAAGTYNLRATMDGYLAAEKNGVVVDPGDTVSVPQVELRGGDTNGDCLINIIDLASVAQGLGGEPPAGALVDINNDGVVNIQDLSITGGNFHLTCPLPPWETNAMATTASATHILPHSPLVSIQSPTVLISPASSETGVSEDVTVDVRIEDVANLYAAEVQLLFDPAVVQVQSLASGTLLPGCFPARSFNNNAGTVGFGCTLTTAGAGVTRSGTLARITFQGVGGGTSEITFTPFAGPKAMLLLDHTLAEIPVQPGDTSGGSITVGAGGKVYLPIMLR